MICCTVLDTHILFLLLFPSPFFLLLFIIFILICWKTYWDINLCFQLIGDWKKASGENLPPLNKVLKGLCVVGLPSCLLPPPGICLRNLLREVSIWAGEGDITGPTKWAKVIIPEPGEVGHAVASLKNAKNLHSILRSARISDGMRHRCHRNDHWEWETLGESETTGIFTK